MPRLIERGAGRPIVLIPGIQGRHEWGLATVEALAPLGRVITFSLADEPTSGFAWAESAGFDNYLTQLDEVLGTTGGEPAVVVGISYGGLIAAEYAARHPGRLAALVVASAPPPAWRLPERVRRYLKAPRLMAPVFLIGAPVRAYPELRAALPDRGDRWHFMIDNARTIAASPASPSRMARRLRWLETAHFALDHALDVPALIVTGEPTLERVVPPADTLMYRTFLPGARVVTMSHTGHAGSITKAREFAAEVATLVAGLPASPRETAPSSATHSSETVRAHRVS